MTGFIGSHVKVGRHHLKRLKHNGHPVTVMYDPDANNEATQKVLKALLAADPGIAPLPIQPDQISTKLATASLKAGFMLIPNAGYYQNSQAIAAKVDGDNSVKMAYYPEIEYWRAHQNRRKIANVHGHNVSLTFRLAASWANNLVNNYWGLADLPDFAEALTENVE
jgi:hypothetical protein